MENSPFEADFSHITLYGSYIKPCCELARVKFGRCSSKKKKFKIGDICKIWCSKPVTELHKCCDVIKIYTFWPLLFEHGSNLAENSHGDISIPYRCELSLEKLCQMETLEDVTDLAKRFANVPRFISGILRIGTEIDNRLFNICDALDWVKYANDIGILQKLEQLGDYCWPFLEVFFAEYKHYISKVVQEDYNLPEEFESQNCENCVKKSECMKKKGNEAFANENFDNAIIYYTKAIEFWPENHLLYGNRALCFLRTGQNKKALGDGKRSIILKPSWPKGHYRFCDALSLLGEHRKALEANERGQELCRNNPEGIKDLTQQHDKLKKQMEEIRGVKQTKHRIKKTVFPKSSLDSASVKNPESKKPDNEKKTQSDSLNHHCQQNMKVTDAPTKENKDCLSDFAAEPNENTEKPRYRMSDSEKTRDHLNLKIDSQKHPDRQDTPCSTVHQGNLTLVTLKNCILDGCTSLMDNRFHNAEQCFAQLLNILDASHLQQLNLALIDYVVVIYGYATALLGIGQSEELTKAEDQFHKITEQYEKVKFNCLAHYGIGRVYLRQNRFLEAMDQFMKSKIMISHKIVPGVLTWPTTSLVIEETRTEKLQDMLEDRITECKFYPNPDAVCRYQQCQARKMEIYFSDPDFKGFIRVKCCEKCTVEFHVSCWKKLKTTRYNDKNDKDFLQELCFTPDCRGLISKIVVFSASGILKCEFEHKIKIKTPPRPIVKQKCSSSRNLQMKQRKKLKRKYMREVATHSTKDCTEESQRGNSAPKYDGHKGSVQKWLFAGDAVLQHIIQNSEKIKTGVHDAFKLLNELLSWWVISEEDYAVYSTSSISSSEIMEQLINYLIQKKSRVKTRIFVHVLSELDEVDPKLHDWMKNLDSNGLKASEIFLHHYGHYVLELELSLVAVLWNEKYGIKLNSMFTCLSEDVNEKLDYFEGLSLMEFRCFLWLLEENRENFPLFHQPLDEYFDKMDNPFTVLKKQDIETTSNNGIKVKNRNRKKLKESRSILVLSGGLGTVTREEDSIFSDESTLSFMNPYEPFRIPDGLYDQVEMFEALYDVSSSSSYQRILDNYPDPTCENLYDYFAQILEEHGPLEIENPLLIGEYECFPAATRKIVEDAGGLKSFLLESLRFVMMGDLIGLMKHAVMLKENTDVEGKISNEENFSTSLNNQENNSLSKPRLNPAAKEFTPISCLNKSNMPISTNTVASSTLQYMTTTHSTSSPFASTYSLSTQTTDIIAPSLPVSKVSLSSSIPENHLMFLNEVPSDNQDEKTFSTLSEVPQSKYIYADYDTYLDSNPKAVLGIGYGVGSSVSGFVPELTEVLCKDLLDPPCISDNLIWENEAESHNESECTSVTNVEIENKPVTRYNPRSRMIAVQVYRELTDEGVNTLPLHPYETQQGDMLRMEKEHQVLQEQLKEASEKYEQLESRSSEEASMLEDELRKSIEGYKIYKKELDWFHQDLEVDMKRWQQEKKENQEGLKVGKNKLRKLTETNEIYMRTIDEKDKRYKQYLDEFIEISNKFENEKIKMEELIKRSHDDYQECIKRAVTAEVSVLENWKAAELYKLHRKVANAEANVKYLKFMTSHSTVPQSKLQIESWESFISNVKEEIKKAENQFDERICMVKNGTFLNSISKVEIAEVQLPPGLYSSVVHEKPPINDPAIIMYSANSRHLPLNMFAPVSSTKDNTPLHSTVNVHAGNKTSHKHAKPFLANENTGEASSDCKETALSDNVCLPQSPSKPERCVRDTQLRHSTSEEPSATAGLDHGQATKKPVLPKPSDNIIDKLRTIFPHYTCSDFENVIKEVKVKNKKLNTDELLSLVTEFILDHPNRKKVHSVSKIEKSSSGAKGQTGGKTPKVLKSLGQSVLHPSKPRPANENPKKTTLPSQSTQMPWKTVAGTSKTKWKKSSDAMDNDPCIICHEELNSEMSHVLDCGHSFHKLCIGPWIKEHSTCPTCRRHVLLPEDYPELSGRHRDT
ncbi:E3 ubiquitin-protein ligase TTC3 isoform X2 [Tiliqua scincoides]|uniref:E3 ubiquitin-protein ligase TTC3 isoform X2 n=1 Tax=Tiliqua scincoides TaxID=71010 RepID=UPI0034624560